MFLRGVNVGGIKVESAKLRQVLTGLGLTDVTTYLASGNGTFGSDAAPATLTADVERALAAAFHCAGEVAADGPVVYWRCPRGSTLATPFAKVLARRAYQAVTTTRSRTTVEKMVAPPA